MSEIDTVFLYVGRHSLNDGITHTTDETIVGKRALLCFCALQACFAEDRSVFPVGHGAPPSGLQARRLLHTSSLGDDGYVIYYMAWQLPWF